MFNLTTNQIKKMPESHSQNKSTHPRLRITDLFSNIPKFLLPTPISPLHSRFYITMYIFTSRSSSNWKWQLIQQYFSDSTLSPLFQSLTSSWVNTFHLSICSDQTHGSNIHSPHSLSHTSSLPATTFHSTFKICRELDFSPTSLRPPL